MSFLSIRWRDDMDTLSFITSFLVGTLFLLVKQFFTFWISFLCAKNVCTAWRMRCFNITSLSNHILPLKLCHHWHGLKSRNILLTLKKEFCHCYLESRLWLLKRKFHVIPKNSRFLCWRTLQSSIQIQDRFPRL